MTEGDQMDEKCPWTIYVGGGVRVPCRLRRFHLGPCKRFTGAVSDAG